MCICSDFLFLGQFIFPFTPSTCISPIFPNTRKTFKELKKIPKMYVYVLVGYGPIEYGYIFTSICIGMSSML